MAGFGLRYGRSQGMDGYTSNLIEFPIDPANTNTMFKGDIVVLNGGTVEEASGNTAGAITDAPILGVFHGWRDPGAQARLGGNDTPFQPYWSGAAGAQEPIAHIALPPHRMFYVKGDDTVTFTAADVGTRRSLIYAAGDPRTADSRVTLGADSATGPVQIHRLAPLPGNAWDNDEPIIEVVIVAQQGTASDIAV